jgi:NAD(P)-dependent dehydrogenase (short-subunit alcohol dehydrogenase family)
MKLQGQVAIVTGAGQGIGRGIAQVLAREGATVVISTIEPQGESVAQQIRDSGAQALFVQTDVAQEESVRAMIETVVARLHRIDILVNNAGITLIRAMHETTLDDWNRVLDVNLRGAWLCSKYAAEEMKKVGRGSIINISSNHAVASVPNAEMYAASKAGLSGMTRAMALSLGPHGIRVNAICPGFTASERMQQWLEKKDSSRDELLSWHVLGRINQPQDIGNVAAFLASDDAAMITGENLMVDGGVSARLFKMGQS